MTDDKEYKGFLLINKTYKVRCLNCGFKGNANLGDEPIQDPDAGIADWCPVCNCQALVADRRKGESK